jgi:hypothetical protein
MMTCFISIYIVSMLCFIGVLIIDAKAYGVKPKKIFEYYGADSFFAFVPIFNTLILIIWIIMKLFLKNKF